MYLYSYSITDNLFKERIVKILVLSIVSLLLASNKIVSSDIKIWFHIVQSTF
jgi:hypothetical protein